MVGPNILMIEGYIFFANVLLPDPESPVTKIKTPLFFFKFFYSHNYLIKLIISLIGVISFSISKDLSFFNIFFATFVIAGYAALNI